MEIIRHEKIRIVFSRNAHCAKILFFFFQIATFKALKYLFEIRAQIITDLPQLQTTDFMERKEAFSQESPRNSLLHFIAGYTEAIS